MPKASQFADVKSALDSLSGMIRCKNAPDLLLKVGEIQGAYAFYERTKDISVLEHLIIDLVLLLDEIRGFIDGLSLTVMHRSDNSSKNSTV